MGRTRMLAVAATAALFFSACGSESSSSSEEDLAALQARVDELEGENAQLREQLDEASTEQTEAPATEPPATEPPTEPLETDVSVEETQATEPPETASSVVDSEPDPEVAQVASLLSFNGVDPTTFPDAAPGEIGIISVLDPSGRDSGLLVLRNGTDDTLTGFEVSATGRDAAGTLVATGSDQGSVEPTVIGPGQLAIASVYMGTDEIPAGTNFEYEIVNVQTDTDFIGSVSVPIIETSPTGGDVLGVVENSTEIEVSGPISILYVCFGSDTDITGYAAAYADQDPLAPGANSPFRATIYRGDTCDRSIAGASGYNF